MTEATCSYCVRSRAEFVDLDGDPICDDCSIPQDSELVWLNEPIPAEDPRVQRGWRG